MSLIKQFLLNLINTLRLYKKATILQSELNLHHLRIEQIQIILHASGISTRILKLDDKYKIEVIGE